jgi:hypothetical protein
MVKTRVTFRNKLLIIKPLSSYHKKVRLLMDRSKNIRVLGLINLR